MLLVDISSDYSCTFIVADFITDASRAYRWPDSVTNISANRFANCIGMFMSVSANTFHLCTYSNVVIAFSSIVRSQVHQLHRALQLYHLPSRLLIRYVMHCVYVDLKVVKILT